LLEASPQPKLPQALPHRRVGLGHPSRLPQIYKIRQSEEAPKSHVSRALDPRRPYDNPTNIGFGRVKL
jgi:hypothetical protein